MVGDRLGVMGGTGDYLVLVVGGAGQPAWEGGAENRSGRAGQEN